MKLQDRHSIWACLGQIDYILSISSHAHTHTHTHTLINKHTVTIVKRHKYLLPFSVFDSNSGTLF